MFVPSPVKLVRRAQEVLDRAGSAPVHMSELTVALRVSRRSLHRAFDDVFGMSPIAYLQRRRLCEARVLLKQQADATVADVAFSQGFADSGRFSGYYHSLFGEYPSETLSSARRAPA
jgi:transcriptional regulator GlxA family with amidase domain